MGRQKGEPGREPRGREVAKVVERRVVTTQSPTHTLRGRKGKVRPWMEQGDTIFADATSPHCSPGVCAGEEKLRRTILYTSWVGRRANDGVPGYAFTPEKIGKKKYKKGTEPYFLVFGKDGKFALPRIGKRKGDIDMKNRDAKE